MGINAEHYGKVCVEWNLFYALGAFVPKYRKFKSNDSIFSIYEKLNMENYSSIQL